MAEKQVLYKGLKSTQAEIREFIGERFLNIHDWIDGFQRGLIVIRDPNDLGIERAYSTVGYFVNHDGEAGNVSFEREMEWTEKEVKEKLRRGKVLDVVVKLDEDANVLLDNPRLVRTSAFFPFGERKYIDRVTVEQYMFESSGAFPRLSSRYDKAFARTFELYEQFYNQAIGE